ncbi:uncharacterized protein LACBIDRAFT_328607 [Laccaria bicolor S238N-H82]|uniref:Predicted protein n=1 Tax=Laccaria bicolor (strain S238N-H82 / ATCC MYA-4686) TaxID=486041 RepID=B0DFE8_LACBS|nr:uncharacterized protein LACBIDRAFT_328607 [Laccaria bicolor S238N-H82]EDR06691.1 predicted protein [Laccaria bicolor S238N-H82]|eukprot:XP_001882538.1 predicted protein [Laccaria bicolor S238N-H82]
MTEHVGPCSLLIVSTIDVGTASPVFLSISTSKAAWGKTLCLCRASAFPSLSPCLVGIPTSSVLSVSYRRLRAPSSPVPGLLALTGIVSAPPSPLPSASNTLVVVAAMSKAWSPIGSPRAHSYEDIGIIDLSSVLGVILGPPEITRNEKAKKFMRVPLGSSIMHVRGSRLWNVSVWRLARCRLDFPYFYGDTCQKCVKRAAAKSEVERGDVEHQPQCLGCSVIYLFMKHEWCGACIQKELDANSEEPLYLLWCLSVIISPFFQEDLRTGLIGHAAEYQKTASDHRLNQAASKQNPQLQQATWMKEQLAMVCKASKVDTYTTEISLWIYLLGRKAAKQAQTLPLHWIWKGSELAKDVLEFAKAELKKAHNNVISAQQSTPIPLNLQSRLFFVMNLYSLNSVYHSVQFGLLANKTVHHFEPTETHLVGMVHAMFKSLKLDSKLSASDVKEIVF